MARVTKSNSLHRPPSGLTVEQIERWHALRMMIGFCRDEAAALRADFLVYCLDLGIVAADDHMRDREAHTEPV